MGTPRWTGWGGRMWVPWRVSSAASAQNSSFAAGRRAVRVARSVKGVLDSTAMNETGSPLERPRVAALDAILGKPFRVLDDGLVRVIDYMGSDEAIVQAARVSYGAGTKRIHEGRGR